jgi:hypothetical protein
MSPILAGTFAAGAVGLVAVGAVVALAIYLLVRQPTAADVAYLAGGTVADAAAAAFYRAYLVRQLHFRGAGGLVGVAFAVAMAARYDAGPTLFFSGGPVPLADSLLMGVAGVVVGGLAAESYRIGRNTGLAEANLEARDRFAPPQVILAARLALAAAALVAAGCAAAGLGAGGWWTVAAGAVIVALAEWTQRAIRDRRRPAGPPEVTAADQAVRMFAGRTAAWLELSIGSLSLSWVVPAPDQSEPLGAAEFFLGAASLALAVFALVRSSVRAPRAFRRALAAAGATTVPGGRAATGGAAAAGRPAAANTAPNQRAPA